MLTQKTEILNQELLTMTYFKKFLITALVSLSLVACSGGDTKDEDTTAVEAPAATETQAHDQQTATDANTAVAPAAAPIAPSAAPAEPASEPAPAAAPAPADAGAAAEPEKE